MRTGNFVLLGHPWLPRSRRHLVPRFRPCRARLPQWRFGTNFCRDAGSFVLVLIERPIGGDMPYVCENSRLSWTADDEPIPPTASDFVYLPSAEFGGPAGPAKLLTPTGSEPNGSDEFNDPQEDRAIHVALKAVGVAKVYCRYDGGNDEGFAWVDHVELQTGERLDTAALAKRLIENGFPVLKRAPWQKDWPDEPLVQQMLDLCLAVHCAAALLGGRGFGTGNYSMYGAFVADLVAETITDDPMAVPVVRDIEIEGVEPIPHPFALAMKLYGK